MSRVINELVKTGRTWNNALSNTTSLSANLDYFSKCGTYQKRTQEQVSTDMVRIFSENSDTATKLVFGTRLITRKPKIDNPEINASVASGYGRRDEFYKAIVWMNSFATDILYNNLDLIPLFGSWKDFLNEPLINTLKCEAVYSLFYNNLDDHLVRKYLPQIRSKSRTRSVRDKARSAWAQGFCKFIGLSHKDYRKIKSVGEAHVWQKLASQNLWDKVNFNSIPGKAFFNLIHRTGKDKRSALARHNQIERLKSWLVTQNNVKFTGYPYELAAAARRAADDLSIFMVNKQFKTLLEQMKGHSLGNVLCALDTSGSMDSEVLPKVKAVDICVSMGVSFSMMNIGWFKDTVCMFDSTSEFKKLYGGFAERIKQIPANAMGSTNFQSIIDLLVTTRTKCPEIPVSEYPDTILCISDMEFNPVETIYNWKTGRLIKQEMTNYEASMKKLKSVGLPDVRIIWWCVNGQTTSDFPATMNDPGCYMISGFDPVNLKSLMGQEVKDKMSPKATVTPMEGFNNWLNQAIFSLIKV